MDTIWKQTNIKLKNLQSMETNKYITEKSTYEEMWKLCKCVQKFKNLKTQNMRHAFKRIYLAATRITFILY